MKRDFRLVVRRMRDGRAEELELFLPNISGREAQRVQLDLVLDGWMHSALKKSTGSGAAVIA